MKNFFLENGIEYFAMVPLSRCKILKESKTALTKAQMP